MKKILSLVIVLIAIAQVGVYAKETKPDSPIGVSVIKHGAIVKLFYRGEQAGTVKITIYSENGHIVFRERMENTENFMRPYNFTSLPEGNYTIELADEKGKRVEHVNHSTPQIKRVAHLSRLHNEDNTYLLAVPNQGEDALTVKIYDEHNKILYQETESISGNFAKLYTLTHSQGQHTFEIKDKSGKGNRLTKPLR